MTVTSFASPAALQDALIDCLSNAFTEAEWDALDVYKGHLGTGHTLACCPGGLLRVETGPLMSSDDRGRRWLGRPNGCVELDQIIVVTYRQCYKVANAAGGKIKRTELDAQGMGLQRSAWDVIEALACCSESLIRFVSMIPDEPAACSGWTLTVDAPVKVCAGACQPTE